MNSKPLIVTERLELWLPVSGDIPKILAIVTQPETSRHLGPPSTEADNFTRFQRNAGSWFLFGYGLFMIRERGQPEVIGNCGIFHSFRGLGDDFDNQPEAGWILGADHVGKGYASEIMGAVFSWFDEKFGPQRVVCMINPENTPSLNLAQKMRFSKMREAIMVDAPVVLLERSA
ncbi:MAG: GNAT family N-acetyltransferase [Sphingomonadaceae bacterium]